MEYLVSGAGDDTYNGVYTQSGTYTNPQGIDYTYPVYTNGQRFLWSQIWLYDMPGMKISNRWLFSTGNPNLDGGNGGTQKYAQNQTITLDGKNHTTYGVLDWPYMGPLPVPMIAEYNPAPITIIEPYISLFGLFVEININTSGGVAPITTQVQWNASGAWETVSGNIATRLYDTGGVKVITVKATDAQNNVIESQHTLLLPALLPTVLTANLDMRQQGYTDLPGQNRRITGVFTKVIL